MSTEKLLWCIYRRNAAFHAASVGLQPILRTCRVDIGSVYMLKTGMENISNLSVDDQTRFIERYLNCHCSSWIFDDSQLQVLLVNFVNNTVYISAYSVTKE